MTYTHSELGEFTREDEDWVSESVIVPMSGTPIGLCLAEGSDSGPSEVSLRTLDWIIAHWSDVLKTIEGQAWQFYEPYADAVPSVPKFSSASEMWGTERLLYLRIFDMDMYEVTMRFDWQEPANHHEVTFYVEDGRCETHSVDG